MSLLPGVLYYGINDSEIEYLRGLKDDDEQIAFLAEEYGLVITGEALESMITAFSKGVPYDGHYLLGEDVAAPYLDIMQALGMNYTANSLQSGGGGGNP